MKRLLAILICASIICEMTIAAWLNIDGGFPISAILDLVCVCFFAVLLVTVVTPDHWARSS